MKKLISFLTLFTSVSTLICCALPALFIVLGFGAAFAGLIGTFPQLIWVSEHKAIFFGAGGLMLVLGGLLQWRARSMVCPIDPGLGEACRTTRDWSLRVYSVSVGLYLLGAAFAYGPLLFE